jgi:hypothetical protein
MALNELIAAFGMLLATTSLPPADTTAATPAPPGTAQTRYCLRVDPIIGSRIETIQCLTREEWAQLEVDVDQEWAENGVRTLG